MINSRPHEFTTNECDSYHYKCTLLKMPEDPAYLQLKLFWAIDRFLRVWINTQRRLKIIRSLQPDIIHIQYSHPLIELFHLPGLQKKYKLGPVIVTDAGGLAEAVCEDKVGKIVPRATPDGIPEAIIKMMSQKEQFNTYAANMLQAIRYKYSWKIIADKTLSCYRDLLSASK